MLTQEQLYALLEEVLDRVEELVDSPYSDEYVMSELRRLVEESRDEMD